MDPKETQKLDKEFHISGLIIIYKFVLGFIEFVIGLSVLFFSSRELSLYNSFRGNELLEDPHDLLVFVSERIVPYLFQHRYYVMLSLVILGLAKMIGAIGSAYKKTWGVDLLLGVTILILPFQLFNFLRYKSFLDLAYFGIGVFIIFWLVNFRPQEYIHHLKRRIRRD